MNTQRRFWHGITLALVSGLLLAGPASAAKDDDDAAAKKSENTKTKQAQAVSKQVFDKITKAQELIDVEDNRGALKILEGMLNSGKLSDYEKTNVLNYVGFVRYSTDDVDGAIAAYKQLLAIPELEPQTMKSTIYTMAQLSTMQEKYTDAIRLMEQWFALETNPAPQPFILYAQNLYQVNRYAEMVKPIESAIAVATKRETTIKEDWYVLLNFAYFQQENYEKVRDIQKILLVNWPKKRYWISLAGAFTELGQDEGLLTAYDVAHTQGMLEKESELVTMAQLYMSNEVPFKAAHLLEAEMESGRVKKDAKNYRLLSQAFQLSMEDEMAIPALQNAARLSDDGELNLRLGNSHLNLSQYGECITAVKKGIEKGGIKSPDNAQISLGMCLYNEKKYREAIQAFTKAGKVKRSEKVSKQWIAVIRSDIARDEQIRLAETAARKRQEELAKRRQSSERI